MSFLRFSPKLRLAPLWPALAAGLVAVLLLGSLLPRLVTESAESQLAELLRMLEPQVARRLAEGAELQTWVSELGAGSTLRLTVIRGDGVVLADSARTPAGVETMDNHRHRPEVELALSEGTGSAVRTSATTGERYLYSARAGDAGGGRFLLRVAEPVSALRSSRGRFAGVVALALAAALLATAALSWWLDRRLFQPLSRLIAGAGELAAGRYGHRLEVPRAEELAALARALNHLAGRVEEQIAAVGAERDQLRAILACMPEGVLVVGRDGRAVLVNPTFRRLFGISGELVEGMLPRELSRHPDLSQALAEALDGRPAGQRQIEVYTPRRRTLALAADTLRSGAGGAIVTVRDTTESNRVSAMRRDFVANVSHELKTPLAAIRGFAETLRDGALDEPDTARRFTRRILEHCRRLQALLDDLLTLSRLESVEVPLEMVPVDLEELAQRAAEVVSRAAQEHGVTVAVAPAADAEVIGDEAALERMLVNLIDNAVKYNRFGGRVDVTFSPGGGEVVIEVADTGIGIAPEQVSRIFERFYRVDKGRARDEGGTGLGLAIVKHAAQGHGGRVEVDSETGRGTTFRVRLPTS